MKRPVKRLIAAASGLAAGLGALVLPAAATPPVYPFPTLSFDRMIKTRPFLNSTTIRPGDIEGMAFDPVRNTLFASDDSKFRLYEINFATGFLERVVTRKELSETLRYVAGGPPVLPIAGDDRAYDLEAVAYDAATDTMYAFAGHCCSAIHHGTVWRLKRKMPEGWFVPESYQPLDQLTFTGITPVPPNQDDFSGVGVIGGKIYLGGHDLKSPSSVKTLFHYVYETNTIDLTDSSNPIAGLTGQITGISDSAAVAPASDDVWITTSADKVFRLAWGGAPKPTPTLVPNHAISLKSLGLGDSRAVEIVGDQVVMADGFDFYPKDAPYEFAIHVFNVRQHPPTASFTAAPTTGGAPLPVQFTDTSANRPVSWLWDFGDGTTSAAQNPAHTYATPGLYTVTLSATNPNGTTTASTKVDVTNAVPASFSFLPTQSSTSPAVGATVSFTDTTAPALNATAWAWNFGDGATSALQNPTHVYTAVGNYTVKLTVTTPAGLGSATQTVSVAGPPVPSFTADPSTANVPALVSFTDTSTATPPVNSWSWDFGDGSPVETNADPTHTYTSEGAKTVTLTVSNGVGVPVSTTLVVQINRPPSFTFLPAQSSTSPAVGATVSFTDTTAPALKATAWAWEFGDGATSALQNPTHVYTAVGSYTVKLTVTTPAGLGSASQTVSVAGPPVPSFTADPSTANAPALVSFTDTTTATPPVNSWSWDFGDGTPVETNADPTHTYTSEGPKTVTLTVSNGVGAPVSTTRVVQINKGASAAFSPVAANGLAPLTVTFTDESVGTPKPNSFSWDFGDGSPPSLERNPTHTFTRPGLYTVTLTANNGVAPGTVTHSVFATTLPTAAFSLTPVTGPKPLTVTVTDQSSGVPAPTEWAWDFGDGSPIETTTSATHTYQRPGTYTVRLTATSATGTNSTTRTVVVEPTAYVGLRPARLLDTRSSPTADGQFTGVGRRGVQTLDLPVLGRGGVPATGVKAVAVNVTAIDPSAESYLTVWPTGTNVPNSSNLNYVRGQTFPNLVVVPVGANGRISLANAAGTVDLAVDVLGYYPQASSLVSINPARLTDTRQRATTTDRKEAGEGVLGRGALRPVQVTGRAGVPAGVRGSAILNVTAVGATQSTYLTVWPSGSERPNASNLNVAAGQTIPNLVVVPVGADGRVMVFNESGSVDLLVDVLGWMPEDPLFTGLTPARLLDTRSGVSTIDGQGRGGGAFGPRDIRTVQVLGRGGVPTSGVDSVVLNITVTGTTSPSYLTAWPSGTSQPTASNLNWVAGDTFPNLVFVPVGPDGKVSLFNESGQADVVVDVLGYFSP